MTAFVHAGACVHVSINKGTWEVANMHSNNKRG